MAYPTCCTMKMMTGSPLALAAPAAAKPAAPALKDESSLLASAVGRAMGAANATLAKAGVTSKAGLKNATAAIAAAGAGSLASKVNATVNSLDEKKDSVPIPAAAAAAAKPKSNATTIAAIGANKEAVNIGANKEAVKPKQPMPEDDDTINAPAAKNATSKNATAVTAVVAPEPAVGAATALPLPPADITAAAAAAAEPEADDEMMVTNPEGISEVEAIAGDEEDDEGPAGPIDLMTVSSRLARMRAGGNATDDDNMIMGPGLLLGPDGKPVGPTEVAEDAPSMEERLTTCTDVPPGRRHTCEQQVGQAALSVAASCRAHLQRSSSVGNKRSENKVSSSSLFRQRIP